MAISIQCAQQIDIVGVNLFIYTFTISGFERTTQKPVGQKNVTENIFSFSIYLIIYQDTVN